jgi:hypothetical protein
MQSNNFIKKMSTDWMLCPITFMCMVDPVTGSDGHSYERAAITEWLQTHSTSPKTRQYMIISDLRPNHQLRSMIEEHNAPTQGTIVPLSVFTPVPVTTTVKLHAKQLHVKITPPATGVRQPVSLFGILDNSGSMGERAGLADGTESYGFTRMDLLKHGVRTICAMLNENDTFGIITFSTSAKTVVSPIHMTDAGKRRINDALDNINPDSQTNIWDGIRVAAQLANKPEFAGSNIVGILFTDGLPNVNPPRGIMQTLMSLNMKNPWSLHTFGFGYNLDSELLENIATWGNGLFGFIPDCSMVGTVFINFLANILSTAVPNMVIKYTDNDIEYTYNTGAILLGQPRDIVIPVNSNNIKCAVGSDVLHHVTICEDPLESVAAAHSNYISTIRATIIQGKLGNTARATAILNEFEAIHNIPTACSNIKAMLLDINSPTESEGQIGKAPQYFGKWGEAYMRAYIKAQILQQSMNFKDPGLQIYGGELFHQMQDIGDKIFCELPPPKASGQAYKSISSIITAVNMGVFHNQSGGCFHGECMIKMADNTLKQIQDISVGEHVWTPTGSAKVRVVVECNTYARSQPMSQMGKLCITPWHPVRVSGEWKFPANIVSYTSRLISKVYNFVLDSGHIVDVEGVECVTLGHGLQEEGVTHAYFGTDAVIGDLKVQPGWDIGRPVFKNLVATRDASTSMINGWVDVI